MGEISFSRKHLCVKTKNYPALNVNSSEAEKPWYTQVSTFLSGIMSLHLDDAVLVELWYLLSD